MEIEVDLQQLLDDLLLFKKEEKEVWVWEKDKE